MRTKILKTLSFALILGSLTSVSVNAVTNGENVEKWNGYTISIHLNDTFKAASLQNELNPEMKSQYCSATLTSPTIAVTSGWCVTNSENHKFVETLKPSDIFIGAGVTLNSSMVKYEVESIKVHPDYDPMRYLNDIAVIKLKNEISESRPVAVGNSKKDTQAEIYGWGARYPNWENSGYSFAENLQYGEVTILPNNVCSGKKTFTLEGNFLYPNPSNEVRKNIDKFHCAIGVTSEKVDVYKNSQFVTLCSADEGSGLVDTSINTLVGVGLHDINCASAAPEFFTKTSSYKSFILKASQ